MENCRQSAAALEEPPFYSQMHGMWGRGGLAEGGWSPGGSFQNIPLCLAALATPNQVFSNRPFGTLIMEFNVASQNVSSPP